MNTIENKDLLEDARELAISLVQKKQEMMEEEHPTIGQTFPLSSVLHMIDPDQPEMAFASYAKKEIQNWLRDHAMAYKRMMACYRCALMEVETKFNVLNEELSLIYDRNPIETIKSRLKSPESIEGKLKRLGLPLTVESIENNLFDVAGIRVICAFPDDVYKIADAFLAQDDVVLIQRKDYIQNPKPSGYRSLHLIIEIPIFLYDQKKPMKVEVQLRTISMDWWASVEHRVRYKKEIPENLRAQVESELKECAEINASLDRKMQSIHHLLDQSIPKTDQTPE